MKMLQEKQFQKKNLKLNRMRKIIIPLTVIAVFILFLLLRKNDSEIIKEYYDNGNVKRETTYSDGQPHGIEKWYFPTGELKTTLYYQEGIENGEMLTYYQNGNVESRRFWKNGIKDKYGFYYYLDRSVKKFLYFDYFGDLVFEVNYNLNKETEVVKGTGPLINIYSTDNAINISENNKYSINFLVTKPTYWNASVRYGEVDTIDGKFLSNEATEIEIIELDSFITFIVDVKEPTIYNWKVEYEFSYSPVNKRVQKDTIVYYIKTHIGYDKRNDDVVEYFYDTDSNCVYNYHEWWIESDLLSW